MATTTEPEAADATPQPAEPERAHNPLERHREFARLTAGAMLAWALIWAAIIASLLLFGDSLSAVVV